METFQSTSNGNNNSIYKLSRTIKRKDNNLYNALRSIYQDSIFVGEISLLWPTLPLLANLRCGLWYFSNFHSNCYFKSTDGHTNNLSFNTSRLNLHVAHIAAQKGGCFIVDSTRKGKRFPDSMSKTIPIWTCVLNRAIRNFRERLLLNDISGWDCSLHLPLWVSQTERKMIENRLEGWTQELEESGADISSIALTLKKPLRPLWISQKTVIWLNEVPDYDSWDFTPIILINASSTSGYVQNGATSEFSWNYIAGAGDDEESWARGLSPNLFWKHAYEVISSGPDACNQLIANIVEDDRVRRAQRGEHAPQLCVKSSKCQESENRFHSGSVNGLDSGSMVDDEKLNGDRGISYLGSTNIAVGRSQCALEVLGTYSVLHCDAKSLTPTLDNPEGYLHLPILDSKFDRYSLLSNLPSALDFAKAQLRMGKSLLICCSSGEDISVCICLAILCSFCDESEGIQQEDEDNIVRDVMDIDSNVCAAEEIELAPNEQPAEKVCKTIEDNGEKDGQADEDDGYHFAHIDIQGSLQKVTAKTLLALENLYKNHVRALGFGVRRGTGRIRGGIESEKYLHCACQGASTRVHTPVVAQVGKNEKRKWWRRRVPLIELMLNLIYFRNYFISNCHSIQLLCHLYGLKLPYSFWRFI